jgi:CheY-like chemotaxis protein
MGRDRATGAFLACLNHEVRTPLSGILGMVDLLLETQLDDEQREYVQTARTCAENLHELLNATLEYSALEAGYFTLEEYEFSVRDTIEAAMAQHWAKADAKGLHCTTSVDINVPETLIGDAPHLKDLLSHLVANAVKFTHSGSIEIDASFQQTGPAEGWLIVAVRDTGIGIPEDRLDMIFESFRQGETGLSRSYPGLGLGLAVAQKIAGLMKGRIRVESKVAAGSTFSVEIPVHAGESTLAEFPMTPPLHDGLAGAPRILAVDDNAVGLKVLRRILARRGVHVEGAESARDALRAAELRHYDLVLMDLQMPDMDGLAASAALRKVPGYENVPILALTANCSDEMRERCRAQGMQAFLSKPLEADELWAAISRYLKH